MVAKTKILAELNRINNLYIKADSKGDNQLKDFWSKLALLEFCGWIEQSIDDIIEKFCKRKLSDTVNINYLNNKIIKSTYGFDYNKHFRKMLIEVIGIIKVERLEKKVNNTKLTTLKSHLGTLKRMRDNHAHNYLSGVTHRLHAPSFTISFFNGVYEGLREYESKIK